jgi:plasmid stabilization system protein ParE
MVVTVRSQAELDIAETLEYYLDEETPVSADRFIDAVEAAYPEILEAPYRYPADRDGVRQKPIAGFPCSILYSIQDTEIVVLSVRHHKRKPGFWRKRL